MLLNRLGPVSLNRYTLTQRSTLEGDVKHEKLCPCAYPWHPKALVSVRPSSNTYVYSLKLSVRETPSALWTFKLDL